MAGAVEPGDELAVGGTGGFQFLVTFGELAVQFDDLLIQSGDLLLKGVDVGGCAES